MTAFVSSAKPKPKAPLTVGQFYDKHAGLLKLRLLGPKVGMDRIIREPTVNRPGLALAGFLKYFAKNRIQVIGAAENSYLKNLDPDLMRERLRAIFKKGFPCLVIARSARVPKILMEVAAEYSTPVFQTPEITMKFINAATLALESDFSPETSEYGSMMDIMGIGTLIRGESGIGKSECVLGLIERGYSLVSDDITLVRFIEGRELVGTAPEISRFHMEVRGIGIINVASIFGVGAVRVDKRLDLVVTLREWTDLEDVDRIGLDQDTYEILGVPIPHVTIPVRPGRDIARLVEVAAFDQKLKSMGTNSALEFNKRLLQFMRPSNSSHTS
jgi:HPr kinase/phosphorylase